MPDTLLKVITSLDQIMPLQWNALARDYPFLKYEFFKALEDTQCIGYRSGWTPQFITLWDENNLVGAMPLYLKHHSYGEYVFDWAWADAYQRYGYRYYPKLISAIPFTPITSPRALATSSLHRAELISAALNLAKQLEVSSFHCLFPTQEQADEMVAQGMALRTAVQFHWRNADYHDFEHFLFSLAYNKRKKIKQERNKLQSQGIQFQQLTGSDIRDTDWEFFTQCYNTTYRKHHSVPYLNEAFFKQLGATLPEYVLLIMARRERQPIAAALNLYNKDTLYGRYWGSVGYWPGLHFETCYYQAIEFCIHQGIKNFEAGAQGEHKLARGFAPTPTYSAHWLAHPEFSSAIERYLEQEARTIGNYIDELNEHLPFRRLVKLNDKV